MSDPKDSMWVITAEQIKKIKAEMGPMPYDKVERTLETLAQLVPLRNYLPFEPAEKAPEGEPTVKKLKLKKAELTEEELLKTE